MRLSGQFRVCLFFFYKEILKAQKALKCKTNDFYPLRSFCAQKIVALVVFCSLIFVLLVDFCLICIFVLLKSFHKINK